MQENKHLSVCFCVSDNRDLVLQSSPVPEVVREPLGASPHLPAPALPLPFLGKKIAPCLPSAAVKGPVRVDAVWLLMQTSAGGEPGAGWLRTELVTQMCRCLQGSYRSLQESDRSASCSCPRRTPSLSIS